MSRMAGSAQWHGGGSSQLTSGPQDGGKMTEPPCMGGGTLGMALGVQRRHSGLE